MDNPANGVLDQWQRYLQQAIQSSFVSCEDRLFAILLPGDVGSEAQQERLLWCGSRGLRRSAVIIMFLCFLSYAGAMIIVPNFDEVDWWSLGVVSFELLSCLPASLLNPKSTWMYLRLGLLATVLGDHTVLVA